SQVSAPSKAVRDDFQTRTERRRIAWDNWSARSRSWERGVQKHLMSGLARELLALGGAALLVLAGVWLFRWAVLSPAVWGVLSPILATVVSIALMGGLVWLTKIDKRSGAPATRRAARARAAKKAHQATLSEAISTADALTLTTGG